MAKGEQVAYQAPKNAAAYVYWEWLKPESVHCFTGDNDLWRYRRMIDRDQSPHLKHPVYERERLALEHKYGKFSQYVQSLVYGRFGRGTEENVIFSDADIKAMRKAMTPGETTPLGGDVRAALDIGGDGAESDDQVFMVRCGTEIVDIQVVNEGGMFERAKWTVDRLKALGILPWQLWVDGGGIGGPIASYMEQTLGYMGINRYMANTSPTIDRGEFTDAYTERHFWLKELLQFGVLKVKHCERLLEDMRDRRYVLSGDGETVRCQPKKGKDKTNSHRGRTGRSPDHLDTLVYLFMDFPMEMLRMNVYGQRAAKAKASPDAVSIGQSAREIMRGQPPAGLFAGLRPTQSIAELMHNANRQGVLTT